MTSELQEITINENEFFLEKVSHKKTTLAPERIIKQTNSFFTFWSKGSPDININGDFKSEDGSEIWCRHLAAAQLFHDKAKFGKTYHEAFENPSDVSFLNENKFDNNNILYGADSYHLFNIKNIGHELSQLSAGIEDSMKILFMAQEHSMSITIKNKGKEGYVIQFYDPNRSLAHKQILFPDLKSISSLQLCDILDKYYENLYFPKLNGFFAINIQSEPTKNATDSISYSIGKDVSAPDQLFFGLTLEYTPWISAAIKNILASDLDTIEKFHLLAGKIKNDIPFLFIAFGNGFHHVVAEYIIHILASNLDVNQKIHLLECRNPNGTPGLFMALQNGHHMAVAAYLEQILASNLDNNQKIQLLACKRANGTPGLLMALQLGHHKTVAEYVGQILASDLDIDQKINLLLCENANGTSGLLLALQKGHYKAVTEYVQPLLALALEYGYHRVVANYTQDILTSKLSNEQKIDLLACKNANGTPGLSLALEYGQTQAVVEYMQNILNSTLCNKQKENLLLCQDVGGYFGIFLAIKYEHYDTASAYFREIQKMEPKSISRCLSALGSNFNEAQQADWWNIIKCLAPDLLAYKDMTNNSEVSITKMGP